MAKDKEKAVNPAAAQRKAEKQKALKKGKAAVAAQRAERLAHRNPQRLQAQIDALKDQEASASHLSARDRKSLEDLETEISRIYKAKEVHGKTPRESRGRGQGEQSTHPTSGSNRTVLGKRGRWQQDRSPSATSDTEDDVKDIPMPRDTPPPVPTRRRPQETDNGRVLGEATPTDTKPVEPIPAKTVYESKPIIRNLRKEAAAFVPNAVRRKVELSSAQISGKYLEPEELDALEKQGYGTTASKEKADNTQRVQSEEEQATHPAGSNMQVHIEEVDDEGT